MQKIKDLVSKFFKRKENLFKKKLNEADNFDYCTSIVSSKMLIISKLNEHIEQLEKELAEIKETKQLNPDWNRLAKDARFKS